MSYVIDKNGRRKDGDPDDILKDGERLVVPLMMMDHSAMKLHDGMGNAAGHKPGYVFRDGEAERLGVDDTDAARREYESQLSGAWRNSPSPRMRADSISDDDAYAAYEKRLTNAWRTP